MIESAAVVTKRAMVYGASLLVTTLAFACAPDTPRLHGSPAGTQAPAPPLELVDTAGNPFRLADGHGTAVLIYFGYTHCPEECPLTLANAQWMVDQLGSQGDRLNFILVTVDPVNDTPTALRAFLDRFNPRFIGLTGTDDQLALARRGYGVVAATPAPGNDPADVVHGTRVYLVDLQGNLVTSYDLSVPKEDILSDVGEVIGP